MLRQLICGALAVTVLQGCSAIGLGIGAATPRVTDTPTASVQPGEWVAIYRRDEAETVDGAEHGRLVAKNDVFVEIESDDGTSRIPTSQIDHVRAKRGNHWLTGMLIGIALDVAVIGAVAASMPWDMGG
jgi:hypothetical protein